MKSSTTVIFLIVLSCELIMAQVPQFEWVTGPQGSGHTSFAAMADIATDTSGNVIICANFSGTINFGSTTLTSTGEGNNICLAKYNSQGEVLWARRIGDVNGGSGDIAADKAGNIYLTGGFSESLNLGGFTLETGFCLVKFDPSGNVLWAKQTNGTGSAGGKCMKTDEYGNVYVAGDFYGTPSFEDITLNDEGDVFIAKYDPSGNVQWVKQSSGSGYTGGAYGIGVDKDGNSVITGWFDGTLVWGTTTMTCTFNECFAVSYGPQGDILWAKHIGQGNLAGGYAAAYDDLGNCYLAGDFENTAIFDDTTVHSAGSWDSFIVKYNPAGELLWVRTVGGADPEHGWGIDIDPYYNVVFTGCFANSATFGSTTLTGKSPDRYDIFLAKYDKSGNFLWAKRAGSDENDQGRGIAVNNKGRIFTTGWIQGTADFDSHEFSPTGTYGIFLSLLEENYINVTPLSSKVGYTSGSTTFSVDANVAWSVSETSSWLSSTKNGDNIDVDYSANPDPAERTAIITVNGDGCAEQVTVVQDPAPCRLTVTPDNPTVSYTEGNIKLLVDSNSDWSFSETVDWLSATKTHSDTLAIEFDANESYERSSTITVFNSCLETTDVSITQDGKPNIVDNLFDNNQLSIYPIPSNDIIYLKSEREIDEEFTVSLFDNIGRMVFSQSYRRLNISNAMEIDISGLESGIYSLQISSSKAWGAISVVKE